MSTNISYKLPRQFTKQSPMHIPRPRYIILHHTKCMEKGFTNVSTEIDTKKYQYQIIKKEHIEDMKLDDVNYHYIIDKLNGDWEVFLGRPIHYPCYFEDIKEEYFYSIHVAILGDFDMDIAVRRLYEVLSYKVISPLMYWFTLEQSRIKLHNEVSDDKNCTCPGDFFFKANLLNILTKFKSNK